MAQKTDIQLSTQADEVRDETTANANSALRVGTLFEDIVDSKMNNSLLIDEDNMASDSATRVPSQQSVKAYVDAQAGETASAVTFTPAGNIAASNVQAALEEVDTEKADKESFTVLSDGSTVTWNTNNRQFPTAKLTSTQSFTIDMTNVKDGARGVLKLITNTASAIVMTMDTSFTNKILNTSFTTYQFPALTGQEYFLSWVCEGTTIEWVIGDITRVPQVANVQRAANQAIASDGSVVTAIIFDTENADSANIWSSGNPTRLTIPGTGNKLARLSGWVGWDASATGERRVQINKNGGTSLIFTDACFARTIGYASNSTTITFNFQISCVGGDYLEVMQFQNSTASRNVTAAVVISVVDR